MFRENVVLANVHSVGEKDVWLKIDGKLYNLEIPAARLADVQQFLFRQLLEKEDDEEWLLPIDIETKEIYIYEKVDAFISEQLAELMEKSKEGAEE